MNTLIDQLQGLTPLLIDSGVDQLEGLTPYLIDGGYSAARWRPTIVRVG